MENGDIPNANIQASSEYKTYYGWKARLNGDSTWAAIGSDPTPWIQANIGYQTYVSGVITQGDGRAGNTLEWVTSMKISTFLMSTSNEEKFVKNEEGAVTVSSL